MSFERDGYEVVDMDYGGAFVRDAIEKLSRRVGYLPYYRGDSVRRHEQLAAMVADLPRRVIEVNIKYFQSIMGRDILIQKKPYLRISRPGKEKDNIGYHRDTWYGDTPYEISVWIPLTNTDTGNALCVLPGSHVASEKSIATKRISRPDVKKGSAKHGLGFIYDPPLALANPVNMTPVPVKVGQMIVFPLSLLHGQEVNDSDQTRFSIDCRLAAGLAPIRRERSRAKDYYETLCETPLANAARRYYAANK